MCQKYAFLRFLNYPIRKSFKRLPTTTEWARFRKYARRIRELIQYSTQKTPPLEVFSVIQLGTINEHLFPNLEILESRRIEEYFIPFIPLLLSPRTTNIALGFESNVPEATIASTITTLPTLCPNAQAISIGNLKTLPEDLNPIVVAAVSGMLLANRNTLQEFAIDFSLTKEISEVLYELPNLRSLSVVIGEKPSLPSLYLPNITELEIICDDEDGWLQLFHGATLGRLESVSLLPRYWPVGDFLGPFKRAALSSSIQNTLSKFYIFSLCSWNPNYSSLLPFTQLIDLEIESPCDDECSSTVDDDIVINLSRAMPKLKYLRLGDDPCRQPTTGVTAKGLMALARHCQDLSHLRIHFQVASLSVPLAGSGAAPNAESTVSWTNCALTDFEVGKIPVPEGSMLMVALTLLRIFPRLIVISGTDPGWAEVGGAMYHSKGIVDRSGKQRPRITTP